MSAQKWVRVTDASQVKAGTRIRYKDSGDARWIGEDGNLREVARGSSGLVVLASGDIAWNDVQTVLDIWDICEMLVEDKGPRALWKDALAALEKAVDETPSAELSEREWAKASIAQRYLEELTSVEKQEVAAK